MRKPARSGFDVVAASIYGTSHSSALRRDIRLPERGETGMLCYLGFCAA